MTTIPRPRLVSSSTYLAAEDMPEQVTIALREIAGAAKEGLLAFSVGIGLAVLDELFEAEVVRLAGPKGKACASNCSLCTGTRAKPCARGSMSKRARATRSGIDCV
jgi:putative transposase